MGCYYYHTENTSIFALCNTWYFLYWAFLLQWQKTKFFKRPPIRSVGFILQEDWLICYDLPKPNFTPGISRSSEPHKSQSEAANKLSALLCSYSAVGLWKCPADPLLSYPLPHLLHHSHSLVGLTLGTLTYSGKFLRWHENSEALLSCKYTFIKSWSPSKCEEYKVFGVSISTTAAPKGVSFPVQLGGMLLHQVKCTTSLGFYCQWFYWSCH